MALENGKRLSRLGAATLLGFAAMLGLIVSQRSVLAHAEDGHPVRIHDGTCQSLGPVAFSLTGVNASVDLDGNPVATPQPVHADRAHQVMISETSIATTVADLLASDHAVMINDNDEDMQAISCGNFGGAQLGDTLAVGLGEVGIPGHVGFALFQPDGEKTDITILIGHAMAPVSAGGATADMSGDSTHQIESEEGHDHMATPEA